MKYLILLVVFIFTFLHAENNTFENFKMTEFEFQGHAAKIVFPDKANEQRYWIWRARFWGHEPQLDRALLQDGFHVVYVDVADLYGSPTAVNLWNDFYTFLIKEYNLNNKAVLEGMSRGGLIIYNWAAENTDKVFCIYADAPVCDIKSWPGGLLTGPGSPEDWQRCLNVYNLNEKSVAAFEGIPLNTCKKVARAKIPVIHVCGEADKVVPYVENTKLLARHFKNAGGKIKIILKPGVEHHPHSLEDPAPIREFIHASIAQKTRAKNN